MKRAKTAQPGTSVDLRRPRRYRNPVPGRVHSHVRTPVESLYEYGRGLAGGLLFSLPLLYTMEVWWIGHNVTPLQMMAAIVGTWFLLLGYNRYAGLHHDATWLEVGIDSFEELGLGLLVSASMLWLLGRITADMSFDEVLGRVVLESITVAVGVSVGTAQLGGSPEALELYGRSNRERNRSPRLIRTAILALCGAVLVAGNVAPTEEILVIAAEASAGRILGVALVSLLTCALVLYFSEFVGAGPRLSSLDAVFHIALTYAMALCASVLLLVLFRQLEGALPFAVSQVVVLGLPASIGASAGRLLLQGGQHS